MRNTINLIFCLETGVLENQSVLLVNSLSNWCKHKYTVNAYSPRSKFVPQETVLNYLAKQQVIHHDDNLNKNFLHYPVANKLLACANYENKNPDKEIIVFLDTDSLFMNDFGDIIPTHQPALFLRPVDNKGPGSESSDDNNDMFWQTLFKLFNLPLPQATLSTTVRPSTIRPYYNAGFIGVNKIPGFYQQWLEDFLTLVDSGLRPFGYQSRDGDDFRCLDQMALAVTASRYSEYIKILPETYNYPIPFRPFMQDRSNHPSFNDLIHIHYHKWFQHPGFLDHVTSDEDKQSEQYQWLKKQLPLHPIINEPFKC